MKKKHCPREVREQLKLNITHHWFSVSLGHGLGWEFLTGFLYPQSGISSHVTSLSSFSFFFHLAAPNGKLPNTLGILQRFLSPIGPHGAHCIRAPILTVDDNGLFCLWLLSIRRQNMLSSLPMLLLLYRFLPTVFLPLQESSTDMLALEQLGLGRAWLAKCFSMWFRHSCRTTRWRLKEPYRPLGFWWEENNIGKDFFISEKTIILLSFSCHRYSSRGRGVFLLYTFVLIYNHPGWKKVIIVS